MAKIFSQKFPLEITPIKSSNALINDGSKDGFIKIIALKFHRWSLATLGAADIKITYSNFNYRAWIKLYK